MIDLDDPTHPLNRISEKIRDSAFKIHRHFGPGLLERTYEECLFYDLIENHGLFCERQKFLPIRFEKLYIEEAYKIDLMIEKQIIVEIKASDSLLPVHQAQLLTYMRLTGVRLGYLINFNEKLIKNGMKRFVL